MKKREVGQVSFNQLDKHEKKLWEHAAEQGIFSRYVKRLIDRDMSLSQIPMTTTINVEVPKENDDDLEAAKGFL